VATVGKVVAVLSARTASFDRALRTSAARVRAFGAGLAHAAVRVASFGAGMIALAAGALTVMTRRAFEAIDGLAKMAQSLGISTEKLASFRLAAELANVSQEQLDMALKKMISSVADLGAGTSSMVRAFGVLGVTAEQLRGLRPDEIFKVLADAVKRSGSSVEVLAAVMDIFGSRVGLQLMPLLREGSAGLAAFEREARALGIAISEVDAAKVEAANDAFTRLKALIAGVGQQLAIQLAPVLEAIVNRIVAAAVAGGGMGQVIASAMGPVVQAVAFVATTVQSLEVAFLAVKVAVLKVAEGAIHAITNIARNIEWLLDQVFILDAGWTQTMQDFAAGFSEVADESVKELGDAFRELGADPWGDRIRDTFEKIREEAQRAAEEAVRMRREFDDIKPLVPDLRELEQEMEDIETAVKPVEAPLKQREGQFAEADLATLNLGRTFASIREKVATEDGQKRIEQLLQRMREALENPPPMVIAWE
jgi:hypothetical protein